MGNTTKANISTPSTCKLSPPLGSGCISFTVEKTQLWWTTLTSHCAFRCTKNISCESVIALALFLQHLQASVFVIFAIFKTPLFFRAIFFCLGPDQKNYTVIPPLPNVLLDSYRRCKLRLVEPRSGPTTFLSGYNIHLIRVVWFLGPWARGEETRGFSG